MFKFYHCEKCGELVMKLNDKPCTPACCGEPMNELEAGTTDAALEKHVPAVTREGNNVHVEVGEVSHPMLEKHYVEFIAAVQGKNIQIKRLFPEDEPKADFVVEDGPVEVYEFCNLHGLWKVEA